MITKNDRIAGVLLGQAAGDALGSQYEFGEPSGGHAVMGRGTFGHALGEYTDDTQQVLSALSNQGGVSSYIINGSPALLHMPGIGWAAVGEADLEGNSAMYLQNPWRSLKAIPGCFCGRR